MGGFPTVKSSLKRGGRGVRENLFIILVIPGMQITTTANWNIILNYFTIKLIEFSRLNFILICMYIYFQKRVTF